MRNTEKKKTSSLESQTPLTGNLMLVFAFAVAFVVLILFFTNKTRQPQSF